MAYAYWKLVFGSAAIVSGQILVPSTSDAQARADQSNDSAARCYASIYKLGEGTTVTELGNPSTLRECAKRAFAHYGNKCPTSDFNYFSYGKITAYFSRNETEMMAADREPYTTVLDAFGTPCRGKVSDPPKRRMASSIRTPIASPKPAQTSAASASLPRTAKLKPTESAKSCLRRFDDGKITSSSRQLDGYGQVGTITRNYAYLKNVCNFTITFDTIGFFGDTVTLPPGATYENITDIDDARNIRRAD